MLPKDLPPHLCSQSQLAKELGITHQRVSQALAEGKIDRSATEKFNGKEYLIRAVAIQQWKDNLTTSGNGSAVLAHTLSILNGVVDETNDSAKQKSLVGKARDLEIIFKSKAAQLKYEREAKLLVSKDAVSKALFEFAREHRNELTALPARIIDAILAAKDRHSALLIFQDAIQILLENFSNIPNRLNQKIDGQ